MIIKHSNMLLRRRFLKRLLLTILLFGIFFYGTTLIFGDLKSPAIMKLTNLDRCPACYGITVCPELYSNQITLESSHHWSHMFNAKNIFYGYTKSDRRVVLKKLAHNWEFDRFDSKACSLFNLKPSCGPVDLLNATNVDKAILNIVNYNITWLSSEPRKGLIMCPYAESVTDLLQLVYSKNGKKSELINIWTMLSVNPEPLILQIIPKSRGWKVPAFGGVCGRLEVVAFEGEPLSSMLHVEWHRKLMYAKQIIDAALDFTFKHERFRFYLMDWSLDNIVVNDKDVITFIDLEDIVVLDKHISPKSDVPDWYKRYTREDLGAGFTFSIENMCKHHLSDHNLWAACYVLVNDGLLYPIPRQVNASKPHFDRLLKDCLNHDDRFKTVAKLQHVIEEMVFDDEILGLVGR